jgi:hypothetical protein
MIKVKNSTNKKILIAFGSNVDDVITGFLKPGATDELPIHDEDFFNIMDIE